jgi:hypothetical protein
MRREFVVAILVPVVCVTVVALMSSCIIDPRTGTIVVTERVVHELEENLDEPTVGSRAVCDDFKEKVEAILEKYDCELADIKDISMVCGAYKVVNCPSGGHDWTIKSKVTVRRQDDPNGPVTDGPEVFVNMTTQSLKKAKNKWIPADLREKGVRVIDRALDDLVEGVDPTLILEMVCDTITPPPSPSDPLIFTWRAEVTFQVVLKLNLKNKK